MADALYLCLLLSSARIARCCVIPRLRYQTCAANFAPRLVANPKGMHVLSYCKVESRQKLSAAGWWLHGAVHPMEAALSSPCWVAGWFPAWEVLVLVRPYCCCSAHNFVFVLTIFMLSARPGGCRSPEAEKPVIQAKLREARAALAEELGDTPAARAAEGPATGVLCAAHDNRARLRCAGKNAFGRSSLRWQCGCLLQANKNRNSVDLAPHSRLLHALVKV